VQVGLLRTDSDGPAVSHVEGGVQEPLWLQGSWATNSSWAKQADRTIATTESCSATDQTVARTSVSSVVTNPPRLWHAG